MLLSLPSLSSGLGASANQHGTDFESQRPTRRERRSDVPAKDSLDNAEFSVVTPRPVPDSAATAAVTSIEASIIGLVAEQGENSDRARRIGHLRSTRVTARVLARSDAG